MNALISALRRRFPAERVITDELRRLAWGTDASFYRLVPQVVVVVEDVPVAWIDDLDGLVGAAVVGERVRIGAGEGVADGAEVSELMGTGAGGVLRWGVRGPGEPEHAVAGVRAEEGHGARVVREEHVGPVAVVLLGLRVARAGVRE